VAEPTERVNFDPVRLCNPFFHVAEVAWMFAGCQQVDWIRQFNKRFKEYADEDGKVHGAYGHRWRFHWRQDQIWEVCNTLRKDPNSRRAVVAMWDARVDSDGSHNDYPCNTHIYFRGINGKLDMTVCNRSNDVVWGMTGANVVHMTVLQELVAHEVGMAVGSYHVMTNNAHIYTDMPNYKAISRTYAPVLMPQYKAPIPILDREETYVDFITDCRNLVDGKYVELTYWVRHVAVPMLAVYQCRPGYTPDDIACPQWRYAAKQWLWIVRGQKYES
ncbi:thymidylate synthase, partial [bacterium]|nr:thymidylate synthase [bacterium]